MDTLESLVQGKLDGDTAFHESIASLTDEEKATKISEKRKELTESEWKALSTGSKKQQEVAENYKKRAEKAEKALKDKGEGGGGGTGGGEYNDELTPKDYFELSKAQVAEDDFEEVQKAAKLLGKSIGEALKDSTLQTILKDRAETRRTAEATSIEQRRQGNKKPTDKELQNDLAQGKVPEPGSDAAEDLFWARRGGRPSK